MTDKQFVLEYISTCAGASYDCPFEEDFDTTVLRHTDTKKWFGIIMSVSGDKVGRADASALDVMNLKSNPEDSLVLFELYPEIIPAYHMNKRHWISVILNDTVPMEFCEILIQKSYDLTKKRLNNVQNRRTKI